MKYSIVYWLISNVIQNKNLLFTGQLSNMALKTSTFFPIICFAIQQTIFVLCFKYSNFSSTSLLSLIKSTRFS